jgi:uncharacterized membrane protein YgaE (UPF0421/DUF939 family)
MFLKGKIMTLSIKQKALLATLGVFVISVLAGLGIDYIARNVSVETVGYVIGAGFVLFLVLFFANMMYQIFVSKFEYEENLKKMVDTK